MFLNRASLSLVVVFWYCVLSPLAYAAKSKDSKSHKKESSLNKVDTLPSLEDTGVFTFTSEANLYRNSLYENFDIDFSSANGWDVQLSSYNIPVYQDKNSDQSFQGDTFFNVSKTIKINQSMGILLGSQNGTYLAVPASSMNWQNLDYWLALYQVNSFMSIRAGMYWANAAMSGTTDVLGYLPGITLNLVGDRLTLQADYYSGQSSLSGAVINLQYQTTKYLQSYIGVGVPEQNSGNEFYGIFGFTLSSKGMF
jgi:hypothetical protein